MSQTKLCYCGAACGYKCSICKKSYCSKECQTKDWPSHKKVCNSISTNTQTNSKSYNENSKIVKDLRWIEHVRRIKFTENEIRILYSDFYSLNKDDQLTYIKLRMDILADDLLDHNELQILFDQLDYVERYQDLLTLIIKQPRITANYFEETSKNIQYNVIKWDWDLSKFTKLRHHEWMMDLKYTLENIKGTELAKLIRSKLPDIDLFHHKYFYADKYIKVGDELRVKLKDTLSK